MAHAELERIANHLDVAVRLADAAGLAVATARFALHKERVLRQVSAMCGSRFGRGVVVPGGVAAFPRKRPAEILAGLAPLEQQVTADMRALLGTSSFLDRLRGTGPLAPARAREHGALGPIGKASGFADDARLTRPYDGYAELAPAPPGPHSAGDALARLRVRAEEVTQAFGLIRLALSDFPERTQLTPHVPCEPGDGRTVGWAEAPQGEVLYDVTIDGRPDHPLPAALGVVPQPGADARGLRGRHPHRLPVHRGQLRPLGRRRRAMSIWVLRGLRDGVVTTRWPKRPDEYADAWRGPVTVIAGTRNATGRRWPVPDRGHRGSRPGARRPGQVHPLRPLRRGAA